jgi:tetratricopeptide (TPR) repeat protein
MRAPAARGHLTASLGCASAVLVSFILYVVTLCPTVYWEDSGELISAAYGLGIAHPPGHPLYVVSTRLLMEVLPLAPAAAANVASALAASVGVGSIFGVIWLLCGGNLPSIRLLASLTGALSLALARTFWSQAVIAEVYSLASMVGALLLFFLVGWAVCRRPRWLLLAAFLFGLGMANHVFLGAMVPGLVLVAWAGRRTRAGGGGRLLVAALLLILLGLSFYLYLPLRSSCDPPLDWGDPERLDRLVDHLLAREFAAEFFSLHYTPEGGPLGGIVRFVRDLPDEFGIPSLCAAVVGGMALLPMPVLLLGMVAAAAGSVLFAAFAGGGPDWAAYLLPAHLIVAILAGCGLSAAARVLLRMRARLFVALLLFPLLLGAELVAHWSESSRRGVRATIVYAGDLAGLLPERALFLTENSVDYFALLYLQQVEKERSDIALVYTPLVATEWYRERLAGEGVSLGERGEGGSASAELAAANLGARPVYYTPGPRFMIEERRLVPEGIVYRCAAGERELSRTELERHRLLLSHYGVPEGRLDARTLNHFALIHAHLGSYWHARGEDDEARRAYRQALAYDPRNSGIYYNLGIIEERLGSRDRAVASYGQAIERGYGEPDAWLHLADLLMHEGAYGEALSVLEKAHGRFPRRSSVLVRLAQAYLMRGDLDRGHDAASQAVLLDPGSADARAMLALSLRRRGALERAVEEFLVALDLAPESAEIRLNLALAYRELGRREDAARELRLLARRHPEVELYRQLLSEMGIDRGEDQGEGEARAGRGSGEKRD